MLPDQYNTFRQERKIFYKVFIVPFYPSIPPSIPLPRQIRSVVMQALLTGVKLGSATADTAQMIRKYAAPASIPHRNLRLAAPFEKKSPANSEETQ